MAKAGYDTRDFSLVAGNGTEGRIIVMVPLMSVAEDTKTLTFVVATITRLETTLQQSIPEADRRSLTKTLGTLRTMRAQLMDDKTRLDCQPARRWFG
jgi:hypothetical protein